MQVLLGPRQVGKTTGVKQIFAKWAGTKIYTSADEVFVPDLTWLQSQWQTALASGPKTLLIIDEIQKLSDWASQIKFLWDRTEESRRPKLVLLGSSSLRLQRGLTESLAGRAEWIPVFHWNYLESQEAFGYSLDEYLSLGGYPGADLYRHDASRWMSFIKNSVVEAVIGFDILSQVIITKPALFRQAFIILASHPAQELSFNSLLGQLQDKGNTDLVKSYLDILSGAFLVHHIQKFSGKNLAMRTSIPKILIPAPALISMAVGMEQVKDPIKRGRLFENAVGCDLLKVYPDRLYYWRDGDDEVDFVIKDNDGPIGIEVKSGRRKTSTALKKFRENFKGVRTLIVTPETYEKFCSDVPGFLRSAL